MKKKSVLALVGALLLAAAVYSLWPRPRSRQGLRVPEAKSEIHVDGHLDEPDWAKTAERTGAFSNGEKQPGRPHAEARFLRHGDLLYVALYAADSDVRASKEPPDGPLWADGDTFQLVFMAADGERRIEISPEGKVTDARGNDSSWQSGIRVAHDVDGTVNDPNDEDEEWVLEVALPFPDAAVLLRRCDSTPARVCTVWGPTFLVK